MISLNKVNKYFNKHKKNSIHVINDINIDFPSNGLVALLGPSGCGKTTLLNTIGGLDKINSGSIFIDGKRISKRRSSKVDEIRNLNIGYIFQDYKLVENLTVYENVALSLKIIGLKDKEEINKRVIYTLKKVKMERYKNRPVSMLSGGERQRVGIARAIVKNPKIILADEPTGNLDSKNSLDVMNIIKSISKNYLVILVTHEEELARFYADRIIELKDGVVESDYENKYEGALNYEIENRIYLKDYNKIDKINKDNINLEIYRNKDELVDIKIVFKNNNIYIENNTKEKLELVDNNSNIELINDNYKEIKEININEDTFDIEGISSNNKPKYSSIFKLGSFISYGFKKILEYPLLKKILLIGFFVSGMFIFYSISNIFGIINIKDKDFITINKDYLTIVNKNTTVSDYLDYEKIDNINYILPNDSIVYFTLNYNKFYQSIHSKAVMSGSLSSIDMISSNDLIIGNMPSNEYELVIDKLVIDRFITNNNSKQIGYNNYKDFLNQELELNNSNNFKIVGITDKEEPNIYAYNNMFINIINNSTKELYIEDDGKIMNYELVINNKIKLVKGKLPVNDYEIIVSNDNQYIMPLNKKINVKVNGKKLKVVGYYKNINGNHSKCYFSNNNTIKYNLIDGSDTYTIYSSDESYVINKFKEEKMNIYNSYDYSKKQYLTSQQDLIIATITISLIILVISLVEILLMIRSSFLSRIKEVGIYRAIGVKKSDIYKMFSGEILAITILCSFTGVILMSYIVKNITKIPYIGNMYLVNIFTILISLGLVLVFNLVVGLLPVFNTIRKTPASILSRIDIE